MNINWTALITNAASLTVVIIAIWKGFKLAEQYIADKTATTIHDQAKALAQHERIVVLESIVDTLVARLDQQDKFLAKWTQGEYQNSEENEYYVGDDNTYHIREDVPNLQKKAMRRYNKIKTDFTNPK